MNLTIRDRGREQSATLTETEDGQTDRQTVDDGGFHETWKTGLSVLEWIVVVVVGGGDKLCRYRVLSLFIG